MIERAYGDPVDTVERFFAAIEAKDIDAVADFYTDDVQVWHNFSNSSQDKATNIAVLTALCAGVETLRYEIVERLVLADGRVLQKHLLRATGSGTEEVVIPACMFLTLAGERISRIEEYLDTAQANQLRAITNRQPI